MAWPTVELGEVANLIKRAVTPCPEKTYRQIGVRLWGQGVYERPPLNGAETRYANLYEVREGDIIVNKIWARNGSVSVVTSELAGCVGSPEFPTYEIESARMVPDWFRWFTRFSDLWAQCDQLSRGTSGKNRLRPEKFLNVRVPLPPLAEQRRIVARLDGVAMLIEERRQALMAAERWIAALLRKAFDKATEGADHLPMEQVAPLVRRPVDVQPGESYPELGVRSFGRGTFHKPALVGSQLTWQRLFRVHEGDLVLSNIKAWEGAFAVAEPEDANRVGSHRYLTCVPTPGLATARFICYYLQTPEGSEKISTASPGSADRNRTLGVKKLAAITVSVPSPEKQRWFDRLQAKVRALRKAHAETSGELDALIPAMLHEVFGGEAGCSVA